MKSAKKSDYTILFFPFIFHKIMQDKEFNIKHACEREEGKVKYLQGQSETHYFLSLKSNHNIQINQLLSFILIAVCICLCLFIFYFYLFFFLFSFNFSLKHQRKNIRYLRGIVINKTYKHKYNKHKSNTVLIYNFKSFTTHVRLSTKARSNMNIHVQVVFLL